MTNRYYTRLEMRGSASSRTTNGTSLQHLELRLAFIHLEDLILGNILLSFYASDSNSSGPAFDRSNDSEISAIW